jgi:hypothetical protein
LVRHKPKPNRKPKGTGSPQPGKDRSAHKAARGKKVSLDALAKELPDEHHLATYSELLTAESDRSAAIMASAFVEQTLWVMLNSFTVDAGEQVRKQWFEGATAPFRSFSAKIELGYAIGIYGPLTKGRLDRIRNIRNVFAHRSLPLDFTHPTLKDECAKLFEVPFLKDADSPVRTRYCTACLWLGDKFIRIAVKHGAKVIELELE